MGTRSARGKHPLIAEDVRTPLELTRMAGGGSGANKKKKKRGLAE